jgi:hypothetical protein
MTKCLTTPDFTFQFDRNTDTCVDNTKGFLSNYPGSGEDLSECDEWFYCYQGATHESGRCPDKNSTLQLSYAFFLQIQPKAAIPLH